MDRLNGCRNKTSELDATPSKSMHSAGHELDLWPLTVKRWNLSSNAYSHGDICAKFHQNPSTKYRDIASRETGVNGRTTNRRTDGRKSFIVSYVLNVSTSLIYTPVLTYFIMWTNFTFSAGTFYILLTNYQPRIADILTVIFTSTCDCFRK